MLRPAYKISIGSGAFEPASGGDVLSLGVECDLNVPLDVFRIMLRPGEKASSVKRGDEVSIELGNEGALTKVMTGMVESVRPGVAGVAVTGYSLAMVMAGIKLHQIYEKQASGAIVKDLVEKAGLKAKDPEDGITYPMYTIDTSRSIYEHMREIASLSGFDLFLNADGAVVFKKFEGKKPRKFKYGRDIIGCDVKEITPPYTSVKVVGESPASTKGGEKSHWLSKGGTGVTSGSGDRVLIVRHPAIRDKDTADQVAAAKMESILVELAGTLKVLGNPKVGLGDTIEIKEMPDGRMNGEFEAVRVSHVMNGQDGYVTTIGWIKKVTVSPGESPAVEEPSVPAPPKAPGPLEEMLQKAKEAEEMAKERLVEAVEAAEEALEGILQELQAAMAEVDKKAAEMIAAAGEAKKAAEEAAKEALKQVEGLKKELEDAKKELQKAIDEAEAKYNDLKAEAQQELDKIKEEASKIEKEAADLEKQAEDKLDEAKKSVEDELKPLQDEVDKAKKTMGEWESKAKELEGEARKKIEEAKKSVEDELKPLQDEADRIKRSIDDEMNTIRDLKGQLPGAGASVQGQSAGTDKARKEIEDRIKEAESKVDVLQKQAEDKLKQAEAKKDQLLGKEKELEKELEGKLKEGEEKVKDLKKQAEDKLNEIESRKDQLLGKEKELEKELKGKKEEAMKKLGEVKAKGEEAEKKAGEKLKELEDKVKEARKKLEEGTKELQDKIDEAQSTANSILKEANQKYEEAVKKAEAARKEMAKSMESMKSAYKSAKDKVIEGKKAAGLE